MPSLYPKRKFKTVAFTIIGVLILSNIVTLMLYIDPFHIGKNNVTEKTEDELSRAKYFILDWYDELQPDYGNAKVYKNELQFQEGNYILTVAKDRIRAVYPRGDRYFQLEFISYIEFTDNSGTLSCQMHSLKMGETSFNIN